MFRGSIVIGLAGVLLVALGLTSAGTGGSAALAQTAGQGQPAVRPEKRDRGWVSVSERIALGVEEPTWVKDHGKVHPDVRRALDYQKQVEDNLEKQADWIDVVETEGPELFLGYAYVVVHLEYSPEQKGDAEANRAAIRELQDLVLSKLTAVDFRRWLRFPDRPAIVGFVNEAGLKKLADSKDVRAIGLDDKPYPDLYKPPFYHEGSRQVNAVPAQISPQVVAALERADEVVVAVLPRQSGEYNETAQQFKRARTEHDRVLARLSAKEFNLIMGLPDLCYAWVTKSAVAKLAEDADVREVELPARPPKVQGQGRKGR